MDRVLRPPGDDGRLQLFESVAALLAEVAATTPLLVVLEDVHWADRSSRDLLRYLFARLADEPVAVVASYRSDDLHRRHPLRPLLAELVRLPGVERIELAPLPDPAVAELVRDRAAGDGGLPDTTVDDVVARAEGNAFYAEELLAAALAGEQLPGGLADVLLARVEQLPPGAQQVLRVAAVAGRRVRHELVAAVAGLDPASLEAALAEAVHAHLLVVTGDGRYRYRHALLREAVLADLLPGERVRLHAAVAAHLAAVPSAGTAAERAYHARESNDLPVALAASLEAADQARRVGAPAEQLQHLETALALWPVVPDAAAGTGRDQVSLLVDAAAAARRGGEPQRATALLREALDLLGPDGDAAARARVHYTLAQLASRAGDVGAALEHSATALDLVPAEPPTETRAWALAARARACYAADRAEEAERAATEALAAADALGLDSAWADTAMSLLMLRPGHLAAGERLHEALARARRSGDAEVEMRAWYLISASAHEDGRLAEALSASDEGLRRAAELGVEWSAYAAEARHLAVVARYAAGDWDGSLALAEQLARVPDMAAHVRAASLMVLVGRGEPAAAGRLAWARGLSARLDGHVLLLLATAGAEVELAAQAAGRGGRRGRRPAGGPPDPGALGRRPAGRGAAGGRRAGRGRRRRRRGAAAGRPRRRGPLGGHRAGAGRRGARGAGRLPRLARPGGGRGPGVGCPAGGGGGRGCRARTTRRPGGRWSPRSATGTCPRPPAPGCGWPRRCWRPTSAMRPRRSCGRRTRPRSAWAPRRCARRWWRWPGARGWRPACPGPGRSTRRPCSPRASRRCSACSPRAAPTARSAPRCSSARRRRACTSATSWPSSGAGGRASPEAAAARSRPPSGADACRSASA